MSDNLTEVIKALDAMIDNSNEIAHFRQNKGLTRPALASLTGIDLFRLQCYEIGALPVPFLDLCAIASALETPAAKLFPTYAKILKKIADGKASLDEAGEFKPKSIFKLIDFDPCSWTLKIRLKSGQVVFHSVSSDDADRVQNILHHRGAKFACYDTSTHAIVLSVDQVVYANILWDAPSLPVTDNGGRDEEEEGVKIWLKSSDETITFPVEPDTADGCDDEADEGTTQLQDMLARADDYECFEDETFSFDDSDGELVIVNPDVVAMMTVPLSYVHAGLEDMIFEDEEIIAYEADKPSLPEQVPSEAAE